MGSIHYTVYKTTNKLNGKTYIGMHKTTDPNDNYLGSGKLLKRAIAKHGKENFSKEILFDFDNEDDMKAKEAELVTEEYCQSDDNYNLCNGGLGGFGYINANGNKTHWVKRGRESADVAIKQKYGVDNYTKTPAYREEQADRMRKLNASGTMRRVNSFEGKKHTENTKKLIADANAIHQSGKGNSQYGTMWIHNIDLKQCKKTPKTQPLPYGWSIGRKMKFD